MASFSIKLKVTFLPSTPLSVVRHLQKLAEKPVYASGDVSQVLLSTHRKRSPSYLRRLMRRRAARNIASNVPVLPAPVPVKVEQCTMATQTDYAAEINDNIDDLIESYREDDAADEADLVDISALDEMLYEEADNRVSESRITGANIDLDPDEVVQDLFTLYSGENCIHSAGSPAAIAYTSLARSTIASETVHAESSYLANPSLPSRDPSAFLEQVTMERHLEADPEGVSSDEHSSAGLQDYMTFMLSKIRSSQN